MAIRDILLISAAAPAHLSRFCQLAALASLISQKAIAQWDLIFPSFPIFGLMSRPK